MEELKADIEKENLGDDFIEEISYFFTWMRSLHGAEPIEDLPKAFGG